jgi:hypothetical protein
MFEVAHSPNRYIRTLHDVSPYRLVIWDPSNILRVEDAYESSNEVVRHLDSFSWILVSVPDLCTG